MARVRPSAAFLILLALALPLTVASQDSWADQHEGKTARPAEPIKQQEPEVPFAVWQQTEAALRESIQANKQQTDAAQKQAEAYKETWRSPSVLVNIALAILGFFYLLFMGLQWKSMEKSLRIAHRALLGIKIVRFELGHQLTVAVHFKNYGRLGAKNVRPQVTGYVDTEPPDRTNYVAVRLPTPVAQTLAELMPNVTAILPLDPAAVQLSDQQLDDIINVRTYIYVVGRIGYNDGFEDTEVPLFCYWFDVQQNMMRPAWRPAARANQR